MAAPALPLLSTTADRRPVASIAAARTTAPRSLNDSLARSHASFTSTPASVMSGVRPSPSVTAGPAEATQGGRAAAYRHNDQGPAGPGAGSPAGPSRSRRPPHAQHHRSSAGSDVAAQLRQRASQAAGAAMGGSV